jgi:hypothetical protein
MTVLSILAALALLAFNIVISYLNARAVGPVWRQRHTADWLSWGLIWSAAIQATIGFSMPILVGEVAILHVLGLIGPAVIKATFSLWYLGVIVPVIGTGLIITVHSIVTAWRERNFVNIATAGYNTAATASNLAQMPSGIGSALSNLFDSEDVGSAFFLVALLLAALALLGGGFLTYAVIDHYAQRELAYA